MSERRAKAGREVAKLRKKGEAVQPVEIEGRTIARSFWGKSWCTHLESFGDYSNRLPRGRTYVRNGSVCHLAISKGAVEAIVSGSELYRIRVEIAPLKKPFKPSHRSVVKLRQRLAMSKADRALAQFLDRVATVNGEEGFAYRVKRVTVFGSYLTHSDQLNDVDLLIDLVPRKTNVKAQEMLEASIRARAVKSGRRFGIFIEELAWPRTETCSFLKNRSRMLSLHYTDHALVEKIEHRVVFEDGVVSGT